MKGKRIISLLCAFTAAFGMVGCGSQVKKAAVRTPLPVHKYTFGMLEEDEMPVVTFGGPINGYIKDGYKPDSMITDDVFRYYKEAGINGIVGTANWVNGDNLDEVTKILGYTEKYGINYVTFDTSLVHFRSKPVPSLDDKKIQDRLAFYEQYESFAGIYCQDEAKYQWLDELGRTHQFVFDYNEKYGTNLIPYSNMHPYWPENQYDLYSEIPNDKSCDYEQMIRQFCEKGKLPYLSYDRYSLLGTKNDEIGSIDQLWFANLALVRGWAQEYEIPFWVCLQVGGFWDYYKCPTESEFLWLVNSALACGAKGIEYFPGAHPTSEDYLQAAQGDLGIVAYDGRKTQYYYYSKRATEQIQATQKYLMNAASVGIMASPDNSPDQNISNTFLYEMDEDYTFLIKNFRELRSASNNALVGCFDYQGKTMLYVMNNSLESDVEKVSLNFDGNYGFDVIQRGISRTATGKTLSLNLRGGEAALVLLK
ncbi:MAG: hypothetical protein IJB97_04540 [Clostridia bacterium]|nr:hypothetical protein [Clostridia bacterium]